MLVVRGKRRFGAAFAASAAQQGLQAWRATMVFSEWEGSSPFGREAERYCSPFGSEKIKLFHNSRLASFFSFSAQQTLGETSSSQLQTNAKINRDVVSTAQIETDLGF